MVAPRDLLGWLQAAVDPGEGEKNDALCLDCHDLGPAPLASHSWSDAQAAAAAAKTEPEGAASEGDRLQRAIATLTGEPTYRPCSACHQEHRGDDTELLVVSNDHCQACHSQRMHSFADGHKELTDYPQVASRAIGFDHRSHLRRHYPESDRVFACVDCHRPDPTGEPALAPDFARGCGDCHLGQIRGDGQPISRGVTVLRLPGFDLESLAMDANGRGDRIRRDERATVNVGLNDQSIAVDHRRAGVPPLEGGVDVPAGVEHAEVPLPQRLAVDVVDEQPLGTEEGHDVLTVGRARRIGLAPLPVPP